MHVVRQWSAATVLQSGMHAGAWAWRGVYTCPDAPCLFGRRLTEPQRSLPICTPTFTHVAASPRGIKVYLAVGSNARSQPALEAVGSAQCILSKRGIQPDVARLVHARHAINRAESPAF